MRPRGPLMIEHRLIEKMLVLAAHELKLIKKHHRVDTLAVDTFVDFIRTYADRTHHGKEEDILFQALGTKDLSDRDRAMMNDLVKEHITARSMVGRLVDGKDRYLDGEAAGLVTVVENLSSLIDFYPGHIKKEDNIFFPASEHYFSDTELDALLSDFWEFDRKMIHEKYNKLYAELREKYR
ncbi:MAG: hemerythrin domain-containing protein [Spirochaetia bacterium]